MSEAKRPPQREKVAALAQEIATIGGRLADVDETLSRCAGDLTRLNGQVGEVARLVADLGRDQEGQLDENERLDRRLDALGQNVEAQRHAAAELAPELKFLVVAVVAVPVCFLAGYAATRVPGMSKVLLLIFQGALDDHLGQLARQPALAGQGPPALRH